MIESRLTLPVILDTVRELAPQGEKVYLVGGAVRDMLLGKPCADMDFVVEGDSRPLARRLANTLGGDYFNLDIERLTARTILKSENGPPTIFDFASMRADDLEGDLRARDFTINAIAIDIHNLGKLIDPLGGAADLLAKRLRACSESSFKDDPLRVMRGVRLSLALGYRLEPDTIRLIRASVPGLRRVSVERVRDELFRMLEGSQVATAIRVLDQLGILAVILPELGSLKGVEQSAPHTYDAWEHTLVTLRELERLFSCLCGVYNEDTSANLMLGMAVMRLGRFRERFQAHFEQRLNPGRSLRALLNLAALVHDVGKSATRQVGADGKTHFLGHERLGETIAVARARDLALSQVETDRLGQLVSLHLRIHQLANESEGPSRRSIYRFFRVAGDTGIDLVLLALADRLATDGFNLTPLAWERELDVCRLLLEAWWERRETEIKPMRLINGHDLQAHFNLPPGQRIGQLLEALQESQALGEIHNREEALEFAEKWLNQANQSLE